MNKNLKRYRQINIRESFARFKRSRTENSTNSMEQNLLDLLAATTKASSTTNKNDNLQDPAISAEVTKRDPVPSTSTANDEADDCCTEETILPSSIDLFPSSEEQPADSPVIEQCSSQSTVKSDDIDYPCGSSDPHGLLIEDCNEKNSQEDETTENQMMLVLNRHPECSFPLPKLEPLENHTIMFSPHIREGDAPLPYPSSYRDKWDGDHVRMPCSPQNKYPVENAHGEKLIQSRWDLICRSLQRNIETSHDLENAILEYNSQYRGKWNFLGLHAFFDLGLSEEERTHFFENVLPLMIHMALNLPNICTRPLPLLKKGQDHYVTISQKQIGCLLLNAFFCTFPRRNFQSRNRRLNWNHEYFSYPGINFNKLFVGSRNRLSTNSEKLKCLLNYFRRITTKEPTGTVTFHRQSLREFPRWHQSTKGIRTVVVKSEGLIESEGHGMLQVDFANKFVGGGVLGQGCVQEEIRFIICPELIVSRLFVESLGHSEVLIVNGVEQYSKYSGYSNSFQFEGNFDDPVPRDTWGRRCTQLVAMDATHFRTTADQFDKLSIEREVNKAYCGFYEEANPNHLSAVATGNWGCGAFNGNPTLKFVLQLMAASETERDMLYFTFGNRQLQRELKSIYNFLSEKNLCIGDVWRLLMSYINVVKVSGKHIQPSLASFLSSYTSENDSQESNGPETDLTDSDKRAIEKLFKDVNDDSGTEIEGESPEHG